MGSLDSTCGPSYNLSAMHSAPDGGGGVGSGTLGIAGVGLIGGSIAAAAKSRGLFERVIGFGRTVDRLIAARAAGLIDEIATDYAAAGTVDLFVSCLPVDRIAESVREAARQMPPGSVVTDAGSTKRLLCDAVGAAPANGVAFVGAHPLAGSEKQGFEHSMPDLFVGRTCVVTPGDADAAAVGRVVDFWRRLGCRVVEMSPDRHDEVLARTSHLPHVVAAAVAGLLRDGEETFAAGGFRDVTRVAGGDPDLWTSILLANRHAVAGEIANLIDVCGNVAAALAESDAPTLRRILAAGKSRREAFGAVFDPPKVL